MNKEEKMAMSKNQFNKKMTEVAKILGLTWEGRTDTWNNSGHLTGENQVKIWVNSKEGSQKISFGSCYPSKVLYRDRVEIGVSEDKSPEQIAKDIQRRFLPTYLVNLKEAKAQIEVHSNYEAAKQANIELVATPFGYDLCGHDRDTIWPWDIKEISKIKAYTDKTVKLFEVECSPDLAIRIINLVKEDNS